MGVSATHPQPAGVDLGIHFHEDLLMHWCWGGAAPHWLVGNGAIGLGGCDAAATAL